MKFKLAKSVYTKADKEKKFRKELISIKLKRPVNNLYIVTTPLFEAGIMEIYNYNELLQPYYKKKKVTINILGISSSKEHAKELVRDIIEDTYNEYGSADILKYFGLEKAI